ncbi:transcription factor-like 5 protein [Rhinophrynus dorsalis]
MSGSEQTPPKPSSSQKKSLDPAPPTGPGGTFEPMIKEQTPGFTTTELNMVEMTEIEYTQLQQILCSHMESQPSDGEMETRLGSAFFTASNPSSLPQFQSTSIKKQTGFTSTSAGGQNVHSVICQSSESNVLNTSQSLGHIDFQELRMMMMQGETSLPANPSTNTTDIRCGDLSERNNMRVWYADRNNKENNNLVPVSESRSKSAVCVRLEDRFNSMETETSKREELQKPGVTLNNVLTLVSHPVQLMGVQQQGKFPAVVKNKSTTAMSAVQFTYPMFTANVCSSVSGSSAQTQTYSSASSGGCGPILKADKQEDMSVPLPFCYKQKMDSTKVALASQNKDAPEKVWVKLGAVNKRSRSRVDASVERNALRDIKNVLGSENAGPAKSSSSPPATASKQVPVNQQRNPSQRREKHNLMERDRRRRIKVCCDELNQLVPYCNSDTDKASTLQWTTAFLKYIQERHGDSLKKEFETVFCGKTGRRLKVTRAGAKQECGDNSASHREK